VSGRGRYTQVLRKTVQVASLSFVGYAAISSYWRNYKVAHNQARLVELMTNAFWGKAYAMNEKVLSFFGDPMAVSDGFLGGPWAAHVAGIPFVDPLSVAALLAGGNVPPSAALLGAAIPLVLAALLGKVFCSFLCPGRLLFEVSSALRFLLARAGIPVASVAVPRIGLGVAVGSVLFAAGAGAGIFHFVLPYLAVSATLHQAILGGAVTGIAGWTVTLLLVDTLIAPGQFCHSICPTGAVLEAVGRRPALRVETDGSACPPHCTLCQRACPYGLFPGRGNHQPACDACGRCTPVCPEDKLSHRLVAPGHRRLPVLAALAVLLLPLSASAHHNKGLPHYGYFENYPQVPTDEYVQIDGRWESGATVFNFQGLQRRTSETPNDVRIFAYVYDLQKDEGYEGVMSLTVLHKGEEVDSFARMEPNEEAVYVVRVALPSSGDYDLRFEGEDEGKPWSTTLPFRADMAADAVNWALLGGLGVVVFAVFVLAAGNSRRRHAPRAPAVG
jgi:ferredoxin-type protein NapH